MSNILLTQFPEELFLSADRMCNKIKFDLLFAKPHNQASIFIFLESCLVRTYLKVVRTYLKAAKQIRLANIKT